MKQSWLFCVFVCVYFLLAFKATLLNSNVRGNLQNSVYTKVRPVRRLEERGYKWVPHNDGSDRPSWSILQRRLETASKNTRISSISGHTEQMSTSSSIHTKWKAEYTTGKLDPFQPAQPFTLDTLNGPIKYPSELLPNNSNTPIIFHAYSDNSGFVERLWTDHWSLRSLIVNSPDNTHYVFMPMWQDGPSYAVWMQRQIVSAMQDLVDATETKSNEVPDLLFRMHFVTTPLSKLKNWIPILLSNWACEDDWCAPSQALLQATFTNTDFPSSQPIILKRLDARYDWLPSPGVVFEDQSVRVILSDDGCSMDPNVTDAIAVVANGNCSFYNKVGFMELSKALGVIVYAKSGEAVQDMNCEGDECDQLAPSIPGTMIPYSSELIQMLQSSSVNVTFQTTQQRFSPFFAIDGQGLLAEMGILLYPSFQFFVWQAEWFNYKTLLKANLSHKAFVLPVVNGSIMQGKTGIVKTIKLPQIKDVLKYKKVELDASLSCPGTRDITCPPWDHVMSLYVCCNKTSPLCDKELGTWITPFRRRIGRWLTNITPLLPLFTSNTCTFTTKLDAWWAKPWKPSLNLRFSDYSKEPGSQPYQIHPLFQGGKFDKDYNSRFKPVNFTLPAETTKVEIFAVITGHGSDENGCGEFCVTSHHFVVNGYHENVRTFSKAGTRLGCARGTPITGVEPNEYGTWLYGRNGWCNGREVDPWVIDITSQVSHDAPNSVKYFGWYNGGDPDPKSNSASIRMYSYLIYYRHYGKEST